MKKKILIVLTAVILLLSVLSPLTASAESAYTDDERHVAQVMEREAGTSSVAGRNAVGSVIMNRVKSSVWPNTINGVLLQKGQFGMSDFTKLEKIKPSKESLELARAIIKGKRTVPTGVENFNNSPGTKTNGLYRWGSTALYKKIGGNYFFFRTLDLYKTWKKSGGDGNDDIFYTVKKGDTLAKIAKANGTTATTIKKLNNLSSNSIATGEVLQVKYFAPTDDGKVLTYHRVIINNSMTFLTKFYGVSAATIRNNNGLKNNTIKTGMVLYIKSSKSTYVPPKSSTTSTSSATYYTVKAGDCLYSIANKYGTTIAKIQSLNKMTNYNIYPGQKLRVK